MGLDVTESVSISQITHLLVSAYDSCDTSESVASYPGQLFASSSDSIDISKSITPRLAQIFTSTLDSADMAESVSAQLGQIYDSTYDLYDLSDSLPRSPWLIPSDWHSFNISEFISIILYQLRISVYDSTAISESTSAKPRQLFTSVSDSLDASESEQVLVKQLKPIVSDSIDIIESWSVLMGNLCILVSEGLGFETAPITFPPQLFISTTDLLDMVDIGYGSQTLTAFSYDIVDAADYAESQVAQIYLSSLDTANISESITVRFANLAAIAYEDFAFPIDRDLYHVDVEQADFSESVTVSTSRNAALVYDSAQIAENIGIVLKQLLVSKYESINAGETVSSIISQVLPSVYDSADLSESVQMVVGMACSAHDTADISDSASGQLISRQFDLSTIDSIGIADEGGAWVTLPLSVADVADISDAIQVSLGPGFISVSDSFDISEGLTIYERQIHASTADDVVASEVTTPSLTLAKLEVSANDSVDLSDSPQLLAAQFRLTAQEAADVADAANFLFSPHRVSVQDDLNFIEDGSASCPGLILSASTSDNMDFSEWADGAIWYTGDELKYRIRRILMSDTTLRTLLAKSAMPFGVYFAKPPQKLPSFPLIVLNLEDTTIGTSTVESQIRTASLRITVYSLTNCDAIMERIETMLNYSQYFGDMDTVRVSSISLDSAGPDDYDINFNCYTATRYYRIFFVRQPRATAFRDRNVTLTI